MTSDILSDQPTGQFPSTYTEALAHRASRQASINRPTDKQPTNDREPNKEGDWE